MTRDPHVTALGDGNRTRIVPRGELDLDTREALVAAVERAAMPGTLVEVDLRRVSVINSAGLSTLIEIDRLVVDRCGGRPRFLVADGGPVRRMLELTLLHLSLDIRTG